MVGAEKTRKREIEKYMYRKERKVNRKIRMTIILKN